MGGQVRAVAVGGVTGPGKLLMLGWDLGVALKMAEALGYDLLAVASLLPSVEAVACMKTNEQSEGE